MKSNLQFHQRQYCNVYYLLLHKKSANNLFLSRLPVLCFTSMLKENTRFTEKIMKILFESYFAILLVKCLLKIK